MSTVKENPDDFKMFQKFNTLNADQYRLRHCMFVVTDGGLNKMIGI